VPPTEKRTAYGAAGAVAAWLALSLLAIQIGYSFDLYWLLTRDFEILVVALAGLGITLLAIFWKSSASHQDKVMIGVVSLMAFYVFSFIGGMYVSCANGNCL
jgi:hypothetical protein